MVTNIQCEFEVTKLYNVTGLQKPMKLKVLKISLTL